jgi:Arc/MetJ-type ribon-helix-helix transcriptional regulator
MTTERLDVRLGPEQRRRLAELAAEGKISVSEAVRQLIDSAYDRKLRARRRHAAQQLAQLAIEDVPDPETLSRQLESAHEPGGLS